MVRLRNRGSICAGISYYNDAIGLDRCLESLFGYRRGTRIVDCAILIDGVYKDFPVPEGSSLLSDKETKLVVGKWKVKAPPGCIEDYEYPSRPEWEKRQAHLDIAAQRNYDFVLMIDTDEWIDSDSLDSRRFRRQLDGIVSRQHWKQHIFSIRMHDVHQNYKTARPRLWFKPGMLKYGGAHDMFVLKTEPHKQLMTVGTPMDGIVINHDPRFRDEERTLQAREFWYKQR